MQSIYSPNIQKTTHRAVFIEFVFIYLNSVALISYQKMTDGLYVGPVSTLHRK